MILIGASKKEINGRRIMLLESLNVIKKIAIDFRMVIFSEFYKLYF
jgi:hypothetical protein